MCPYTKVSKEKNYTIKVTHMEKDEALPHNSTYAFIHIHTYILPRDGEEGRYKGALAQTV